MSSIFPPSREYLDVPKNYPPSRPLRAEGNLSYLEFIRLLDSLWTSVIGYREDGVTPRVPIRASGTSLSDPDYPCILYSLEMRKPYSNEAKPKIREIVNKENNQNEAVITIAQRFENYVRFTATDQVPPAGALRVEEIIEAFEDFILEATPVLKQCGLSDIFYYQRRIDAQDSRVNFAIVRRSITYMVITEKILQKDVWRMNNLLINARTYLQDNQTSHATPSYEGIDISIEDQYSNQDSP